MARKNVKKPNFIETQPSGWDKARLRTLLRSKRGKKILVIGDVGVDRYTIGSVERISPEAPVPIVLVEDERHKLGLAANVADNIRALNATPWLIGVIGADRGAQDFRKLLRSAGVAGTNLVEDSSRRTVLKERIVSDRQQLLRVDYESNNGVAPAVEAQILARVRELISKADAVIVEDYAKGMLGQRLLREIFELARKKGKVVAVDPNSKTAIEHYRGASVLTPNTKEAEALTGIRIRDLESLHQAGRKLLRDTSARHVVITRGKEGMAIFESGSPDVKLIPTYAREVYDVSGAGDTVISVLALALASGASMEEAAILGNLAAGVEVGKRGTATVSTEEIEVALEFFGKISVS